MTPTPDQLFEAVLVLPPRDRFALAAILSDSLEGEDEDPAVVAEYWKAEIKRRIEAADRGEVKFLSHEEVWQRLDAKYGKLED